MLGSNESHRDKIQHIFKPSVDRHTHTSADAVKEFCCKKRIFRAMLWNNTLFIVATLLLAFRLIQCSDTLFFIVFLNIDRNCFDYTLYNINNQKIIFYLWVNIFQFKSKLKFYKVALKAEFLMVKKLFFISPFNCSSKF